MNTNCVLCEVWREFLCITWPASSRGRSRAPAVSHLTVAVFFGFVVDSVAVGQVFIQVLRCFFVMIIPPLLHTHLHTKWAKSRYTLYSIVLMVKIITVYLLLPTIKTQQLKWYGHVERMEEGRLRKEVMKWSPPGRRKRGRHKGTWPEGIRGLMGKKGLTFWRGNYFFNFSTHCI